MSQVAEIKAERGLKATDTDAVREKMLSGVQEFMLSMFINKPKLDRGQGLHFADITSSFTFLDRQRGL